MKKMLIGLFMLGTITAACELDGTVNYFKGQSFIQVGEGEILIKDMKWWNRMSLEQKERFANMFRNHSKQHLASYNNICIDKVVNNYSGDVLAEFGVIANKMVVKRK